MTSILNLCPFCGSSRIVVEADPFLFQQPPDWLGQVSCSGCGAIGPRAKGPNEDAARRAAMTAWNRRREETAP